VKSGGKKIKSSVLMGIRINGTKIAISKKSKRGY